MANSYLQRTPSSLGNKRKWTFSCWVKRSKLLSSATHQIFSATNGSNTVDEFVFQNDKIKMVHYNGSSNLVQLRTTRVFRDTSAWYHIVLQADTDNATSTNRWKLYVNGESEPFDDETTFGSQNLDTYVNSTDVHRIGSDARTPATYLDGYFAHIHFTDGSLYGPSTFGQTDSTTGIWKPILSPSVTYGTNGFFLKFASSGSMGTDSSGNGNDFTVGGGNLTQTQDTPSNVFCTLNPLSVATNHTLTNANLTSTNSSSSQGGVNGTLNYPTSGKWYHEVKINAEDSSKGQGVGIGDNVYRSDWGTYSNFVGYLSDGTITAQGDAGYTSYGTAQNVGDIIGVAYNADDQELTFYLNGTSQGAISTSSMDGTIDFDNLCPLAFGRNMGQSFNFGNGYFGTTAVSSANSDGGGIGLFEYEVPSGYYALCTKNINTYG